MFAGVMPVHADGLPGALLRTTWCCICCSAGCHELQPKQFHQPPHEVSLSPLSDHLQVPQQPKTEGSPNGLVLGFMRQMQQQQEAHLQQVRLMILQTGIAIFPNPRQLTSACLNGHARHRQGCLIQGVGL